MIIAVTGTMAAGKNAVAEILETHGWKSIDADIVVHEVITECAAEIAELFHDEARARGISVTNADGSINRRAVGQIVFTDPAALAKQEALVYPKVIERITRFCNRTANTIINATVIYKTPELLRLCDAIFFVTAPLFVRLIRARKRDRIPYRHILARFWTQRGLCRKYQNAGCPVVTIINAGNRSALARRVSDALAHMTVK